MLSVDGPEQLHLTSSLKSALQSRPATNDPGDVQPPARNDDEGSHDTMRLAQMLCAEHHADTHAKQLP